MRSIAEGLVMAFNGDWTEETMQTVMESRAPECQHAMYPASLNMPTKTNEQWMEHFKGMIGRVTNCKMTIHDTIVSVEERRAVCHSSMTSTTEYGPFANEYMWLFRFDDSGTKIVKIDEMFDSAAVKDLFARRQQATEQH